MTPEGEKFIITDPVIEIVDKDMENKNKDKDIDIDALPSPSYTSASFIHYIDKGWCVDKD